MEGFQMNYFHIYLFFSCNNSTKSIPVPKAQTWMQGKHCFLSLDLTCLLCMLAWFPSGSNSPWEWQGPSARWWGRWHPPVPQQRDGSSGTGSQPGHPSVLCSSFWSVQQCRLVALKRNLSYTENHFLIFYWHNLLPLISSFQLPFASLRNTFYS